MQTLEEASQNRWRNVKTYLLHTPLNSLQSLAEVSSSIEKRGILHQQGLGSL
eukprot:CAMPEP_0178461188 /NCGR_PEP_ID=MMETSP0689_2-20121128/49159_1 /TAXON_ID=160604 /ORGANISM="Amphidinium massartii, Strain CS-259" /LENGTH=51 /DNA_ID=CAMNT_0020087973 /DNA_START=75 /DNA_END=227 /DNA_ORIENTATION=-